MSLGSEFGSERVAVLRQMGLLVIQTRSMEPIFYTEFMRPYSSFLLKWPKLLPK